MRSTLAICLFLAACGGNNHQAIDAAIDSPIDSPTTLADAMIDAAPTPAGCDFGEQNDQGNDAVTTGFPEATGLTFATTSTLCGNIDRGHFATSTGSVDTDSYGFTVTAASDVLVSITGSGLAALGEVDLALSDDQGNDFGDGRFVGDHGILSAHIPAAGTFVVTVFAFAAADVPTVVPYKVTITTDTPLTRCPKIVAAASYTEKLDTTANNQAGNDVVQVSFPQAGGTTTALTASTSDAPEPTGLTLVPAANVRITGTAVLPTGTSPDDYLERDTYLVTTGGATNQLAIRLAWPGTTEDFDYFLFPEVTGTTPPVAIASSDLVSTDGTAGEFATFSVLPNTNYWLWIAPFNTDATSGPALPVTYDASICGERFTP